VRSFLFDCRDWTVRYLVVDTGRRLRGRQVLVPPKVVDVPDWQDRLFHVDLTRQQARDSPQIDPDIPVSRQREIELHKHYGWVPHWGGSPNMMHRVWEPGPGVLVETPQESSLRSTREVRGYHIHATDGQFGHVDDFILGDEDWIIRYLAVDTRDWLVGQRAPITPEWVKDIDRGQRTVWVDVPKKTIEDSPPYDYYGRPKYWT
jgi:hypothetical protein